MEPTITTLDDVNLFLKIRNTVLNHGVVVFPTDTLYGLGGDARNKKAVSRVYSLKQRSMDDPLSVIVSKKTLSLFAMLKNEFIPLINHFFPGPLSIILPQNGHLATNLNKNHPNKIAFRILPANYRTSDFVDTYRIPLIGTSANLSGRKSNSLTQILEDFSLEQGDLVIRTDQKMSFLPSTVIDLTSQPPKIVREGSLSNELRNWGCV